MAKRIVIKIGDVFCAEIDGKFKCYFQYIANDMACLNSSTIRVFKHRYPMDYKTNIEDIVKDDVLFYHHTVLRPGIADGAWYKVGKSSELGIEELEHILFVTRRPKRIWMDGKPVDIYNEWGVSQANGSIDIVDSTQLSRMNIEKMEIGGVAPYIEIIPHIRYGYSDWTNPAYSILRRVPREDVDSYTKLIEDDGITRYFHFYGADAVQEIITHGDEVICRLDKEHLRCGDQELRKAKFWDTNWKHCDFISQEEFDNRWNKLK